MIFKNKTLKNMLSLVNQNDKNPVDPKQEDDPHIPLQPIDDLRDYQLTRDQGRRQRIPCIRSSYADLVFSALIAGTELRTSEPSIYEEAIQNSESRKWKEVMDQEMNSLRTNGTWNWFQNQRIKGLLSVSGYLSLKNVCLLMTLLDINVGQQIKDLLKKRRQFIVKFFLQFLSSKLLG